ncbi:ATP-binding cassette domain-containing protein [Collinsella ihumii]|uniref:ATP-binding cassette domain-containing protein n=1 Tax=Collinsella ihumii TaxID=1720204 RepID=A0AAW7K1U2_9ACTN|nr:ATP-binding cassette domain-containing protein [Collinsella ihumii]MDN0068796.1 ATP-binding cassette domain-containing protein [Collinsella ihumii]
MMERSQVSSELENLVPVNLSCRHLNRVVLKEGIEKVLLDDVSIDFEGGQMSAVIGPSGCGKTTLIKALCGVEQADEGQIYIAGSKFTGRSMEAADQLISYLPQFDSLNECLTVDQEIDYTIKLRCGTNIDMNDLRSYRDELLKEVGLDARDKRRAKISTLSGGEKKRVALVCSLIFRPRIIFMDEPTAPLDPGTTLSFMNMVKEIARTRRITIIMVTHDPDALPFVDKVVFLAPGGKLEYAGPYETFISVLDKLLPIAYQKMGKGNKLAQYYSGEKLQTLKLFYSSFADKNENKSVLGYIKLKECSDCILPIKRQRAIERMVDHRRHGIFQFTVLLQRQFSILLGGGASNSLLILLPIVVGLLIGLVAAGGGSDMDSEVYKAYNMTKATMFSVAAGSFFIGIFDTLTAFTNRSKIQVEQLHGMGTCPFAFAVFFQHLLIAFFQSVVLYLIFTSVVGTPSVVLYDSSLDILTTSFLCCASAMTTGMLCSAAVPTPMYVAPIVVLLQLVFSGIIFSLSGVAQTLSNFVACKWAMDAFGSICDLNNLPYTAPSVSYGAVEILHPESQYEATTYNLFKCWLALAGLLITALVLSVIILETRRSRMYRGSFLKYSIIRKPLSVILQFEHWTLHSSPILFRLALLAFLAVFVYHQCKQRGIQLNDMSYLSDFIDYLIEVARSAPGHLATLF